MTMTPTKEYLDEFCEFCSIYKTLVWKKAPSNRCVVGTPIGSITSDGYYRSSRQLVHRLVWCYFYGEFPSGDLDHINGDRQDNRIENLRLATKLQNSWNRKNVKGYVYLSSRKKYKAQIRKGGKHINLGHFDTEEEAKNAYLVAKQQRDTQ